MRLEHYISDLLYRYECVTVPGFGAFLCQNIPSILNSEKRTFFPPQKRLSFNAQIKDNDGLLGTYVRSAASIPYEEALDRIQVYVRFINGKLEGEGFLALNKIGSLSLKEGEGIRFEPSNEINYLRESFGLSSFSSLPLTREMVSEKVRTLDKKEVLPSIGSSWFKYAAVGLIAIGLSGTLGYSYLKNIEDYNFAEKQKAEVQLESTIQQATFTVQNPLPAITLNAFKPTGKYHIVAGAFRSAENAEIRVNQLREEGFKARQIGENRFGLHQVLYGSYVKPDEALKVLREVRKTDNPGAWILVQELIEKP